MSHSREPYRLNLSGEQTKSLVNWFVANFGTWSFNEADKKITYHIEGALFPNFEGATFDVTVISLSGDELRLRGRSGKMSGGDFQSEGGNHVPDNSESHLYQMEAWRCIISQALLIIRKGLALP
jgi:hypothetical protein